MAHRSIRLGTLLAALAALLLPLPAAAGHIGFTIGSTGSMMSLDEDAAALNCSTSGGITSCADTGPSDTIAAGSGDWELDSWTITLDPDPTVSLGFAITNTSTTTQTFTFSTTLPVSVTFGPPSYVKGSVSGSLTDTDGGSLESTGDWATLGAPGGGSGAIYTASIDGSPVRTLLVGSNVAVNSEFGSAGIGPASFGIPTAEAEPTATTSSIGLQLQFTLTPGDQASFTSVFNVEAVPEPGTLALLGVGLAGLTVAGSRRRA